MSLNYSRGRKNKHRPVQGDERLCQSVPNGFYGLDLLVWNQWLFQQYMWDTHTHTPIWGTRNATHHVSNCWMAPGGTWDLVHMFSASIFIITPWCSLTHPQVETLKSLDVIVSSRIVASHLVGRNTTYIIPSHLANLLLNLSMWVLVAGPLGCRWPESLFDIAWNGLPVSRQVKWKGIPLPQWFWRSGMPQCPIVRLCVWFHKEGGIKQFVYEMLETPVQKYWKVHIHTNNHYMRLYKEKDSFNGSYPGM